MKRRLLAVAWLTIVWVALWEDATWANVVGGALVGTLVILLVPLRTPETEHALRPVAIVRLAVYFAWKLMEASAILAWEVVTPRNRINAAVLAVPLHSRSPRIVTMVANMVSLTPGSLTLEVEEATMTLVIHVLHLESVEDSRRSVLYLEQLALAAFPPRREPGARGGT